MSADLYQRVIETVDIDLRGSDGMPWHRSIVALRGVVEVHHQCATCTSDCDFCHDEWPCGHLTAIATALGVREAPDGD